MDGWMDGWVVLCYATRQEGRKEERQGSSEDQLRKMKWNSMELDLQAEQ